MAGTSVTPTALWGPTAVSSTPAALYVAPVGQLVTINRVTFTNISATNTLLMLYVVRAGSGANTASSQILIGAISGGQSMSAGPAEPYVANAMASLVLNGGDQIVASANTTGLNSIGSGWVQ